MMMRIFAYRTRRTRIFLRSHRRLLWLLSLLLFGFVAGCLLFRVYGYGESALLDSLLTVSPLESGARAALNAVYDACFQVFLLLLLLFFCGLSACGLPIILAVPVFFGLGIGMSEAYYYSTGWRGVLLSFLLLLIPSLFKSTALLMASAESMRMTVLFGGHLLEKDTAVPGLHHDFRLYRLRFALFSLIALAGGIVEVLLRMVL